jgi:hypothetical protein
MFLLGFSRSALFLMKLFLENHSQYVCISSGSSQLVSVKSGVLKGLFCHQCFSLYMNDLLECTFHIYADDVQVHCGEKSQSLSTTKTNVSVDIQNISKCAKRLLLQLQSVLDLIIRQPVEKDLTVLVLRPQMQLCFVYQ